MTLQRYRSGVGAALQVVSCFLEFFDDYPMPLLDHVEFTFACESRYGPDETMIHGTGGQILDELRRLLADVRHLGRLSVSHLLLDVSDAVTLLDDVVVHSRDTLKSLQLLNITRSIYIRGSSFHCSRTQIQPTNSPSIYLIPGLDVSKMKHSCMEPLSLFSLLSPPLASFPLPSVSLTSHLFLYPLHNPFPGGSLVHKSS